MSGTLGQYQSDLAHVAGLEEQLVASLKQAAQAIDHMDCFDDDQRSEIYSILQALRQDTAAHQTVVGQWISDRKEPAHA